MARLRWGGLSERSHLLLRNSSSLSSLLFSRLPPAAQTALEAAEAAYEVHASQWLHRLSALLLAALSALLVWSEATLGTGDRPGPLAVLPHGQEGGGRQRQRRSELELELLLFFFLVPRGSAAVGCFSSPLHVFAVYRSLFGLGVFPFYRVVAGATEARSLLANAGQVSRFAAPLAYNYLHVLKLQGGNGGGSGSGSGSSSSTVFAKKMAASLRDVPVFGKSFNNWFPAVVAVHVALLLVDAWGRAARALPLPARVKLLLAAAAADAGDGGDGGEAEGNGNGNSDFSSASSPSTSLAERGRNLVRAELAAAQAGRPLGAGLAAEQSAESGLGGASSSLLPPPSPTGAGGMGSAGRGGHHHYNSPSETELSQSSETGRGGGGGLGGRLASAWSRVQQATAGGLGVPPRQQNQQNLPSASSRTAGGVTVGTARRLAGVSPLTRSLLSGGRGAERRWSAGTAAAGVGVAGGSDDRSALLGAMRQSLPTAAAPALSRPPRLQLQLLPSEAAEEEEQEASTTCSRGWRAAAGRGGGDDDEDDLI